MPNTYETQDIRNIALVGHAHSGKTAILEAVLFGLGVTTRLGKTADGTSTFDYEPEEIKRLGSMFSHFGWIEHQGKKINFIDTPGDSNFFFDGMTSLQGADGIFLVVSAADGVKLRTRRAWSAATEKNLARAIVVNQMDRAPKNWGDVVREISQALGVQAVPVQVPLGHGEAFYGVVDLLSQKAFKWPGDGTGKASETAVSADAQEEVKEAMAALTDAVVSTDDALLESYLETNAVAPEKFLSAFFGAVAANKLVPVLFTCASKNIGMQPVLDLAVKGMPAPGRRDAIPCMDATGAEATCAFKPDEPFLSQVIHTVVDDHLGQVSVLKIFAGQVPKDGGVYNPTTRESMRLGAPYVVRGREYTRTEKVVCGDIVAAIKLKSTHTNNTLCDPVRVRVLPPIEYPKPMISYVVMPATKKDDDKLKEALDRLVEEDPTLSHSHDEFSHRMVLHGLGHQHLESSIERLGRKYKVSVTKDVPPIPYRETVARKVQMIEGKHKKQTGGAGQYGVCYIDVEPLPRGGGFEFVNDIFGGSIPRQFIPSVEKGVVARAQHGLLAGYPVVDFRVSVKDGKYHPVDSKDIAFQQAGSKGFKAAMEKAEMKLLEPHYKMEIVVPTDASGAVMSDISTRRGQLAGMSQRDDMTVINASCPLAEIQRYVADLHSMTAGQGTYTMAFDSYREVPAHMVEKIRAVSPFLKDAQKEEEE